MRSAAFVLITSLIATSSMAAELEIASPIGIGSIWSITADPTGKLILASGDNGQVAVLDASTLERMQTHRHSRGFHIYSAEFFPQDSRIISTSFAGSVDVWDRDTGKLIKELDGHEEYVPRVAVSPIGRTFATAGADDVVIIWSADTYEQLYRLQTESPVGVSFLNECGTRVAVASMDGLKIWDVASEQVLQTLDDTYNNLTATYDLATDTLLSTTMPRDGVLSRVFQLQSNEAVTLEGPAALYWSSSISVGAKLVAASEYKGSVAIWDPHSGKKLDAIGDEKFQTMSVTFSKVDAKKIFVGGEDGTIRRYRL
jgi:WD40 repeat protein